MLDLLQFLLQLSVVHHVFFLRPLFRGDCDFSDLTSDDCSDLTAVACFPFRFLLCANIASTRLTSAGVNSFIPATSETVLTFDASGCFEKQSMCTNAAFLYPLWHCKNMHIRRDPLGILSRQTWQTLLAVFASSARTSSGILLWLRCAPGVNFASPLANLFRKR